MEKFMKSELASSPVMLAIGLSPMLMPFIAIVISMF